MKSSILPLLIFSSLFVATDSFSGEGEAEVCGNQDFRNAYYQVDVSNVARASTFFLGMVENYFNDLEPFSAVVGNKFRVETFYDFEDLGILKNDKELYLSVNKKMPYYRAEREKVVFRSSKGVLSESNVFEVKRYNKKVSPLDKHPLIGMIKRKERPVLFELLKKTSEDVPEELLEELVVEHEEVIFLVTHYGVEYGAITMDKFHIVNYGIPNTTMLLKIEVYPDDLGRLTPGERSQLNEIFCNVDLGIRKQIPAITNTSSFGYPEYFKMANDLLPGRAFLRKYPVLFKLGQIIILSFIGFLFLYLMLGRYKKQISTKVTTYSRDG